MEALMDEYMTDEFLPDLLAEVLGGEGEDYDYCSLFEDDVYAQGAYGVQQGLISEVVEPLIRGVAASTVESILAEYFEASESKNKSKNPLSLLIDKLCDESNALLVREIVKETVAEEVVEYLFGKQCGAVYDVHVLREVLGELAQSVALEVITEESLEDIVKAITEEVVGDHSEDVAYTTLPQIQALEVEKMRNYEVTRVEEVAKER